MIKRPDLFTDDERRRRKNSVNFLAETPSGKNTQLEASAFAVVKPLPNNGALLRTVYPGAISEVNLWKDIINFDVAHILAQGACTAEVAPEDCDWDEPVMPYISSEHILEIYPAFTFAQSNMPVSRVYVSDINWEDGDVKPCSEGYRDGICIDGEVIMIQPGADEFLPADDIAYRLALLVGDRSLKDTPLHVTIVWVAPGLLPDPDNDPIHLYILPYPYSPVILAQADRVDAVELAYFIVSSVLKENGCHHYRPNICPTPAGDDHPWTVQGLRYEYIEEGSLLAFNKHHAEGNEESDRLIPLLRIGPIDERDFGNTHISAYNYKRLFAPIANRIRIWKEDKP